MRMSVNKLSAITVLASILGLTLVVGVGALSFANAGEAEDLSANETCFDCHLDAEHVGLLKVEGKQVHNPENGSLKVEAHTDFACIDCHGDITEIPHQEDVERTVDCLNCHDEPPN